MKRAQRSRRFSKFVAVTLSVGALTFSGLVAAAPSSAHVRAVDVACGETITDDTTLHADLVDCPSNGLVIGADDVTLDLNGHTIDGDGAFEDPCADDTNCDLGVDNTGGHTGVTVMNGTVKEFGFGVVVGEADGATLSRITASDNALSGIVVFDSSQLRIERSTVVRNGLDTDFSGLGIFSTSGGVLDHNLVADNGDIGLYAEGMDDLRIAGNTFSGNPEAGLLFSGSGNVLTGNDVDRNGDGITFEGDDNLVSGNHITRSQGCEDGCGFGISFEGGSGNVFARNLISGSLRGIRVDAYTGLAENTVVRDNTVMGSTYDNIVINPDEAGAVENTLVAGNVVSRAGDDGIDVNSTSTTITGNVAVRNHDLGIEAIAGVTDGGGNKAAGNGDPRQCIHVAC